MAKTGGLGQRLYVAGYDISGDIMEVGLVGCPAETIDTTGLPSSAHERIYGRRDGVIDVTAMFNPENVSSIQEHAVYSTLPMADEVISFVAVPPAIGAETACLVAKQINYDPKRAQNGEFTFNVNSQANQYGLEWGKLLTAGLRTDTVATNGASLDQTTVSTAFGFQAYLHVSAFVGTDVTIKIQDSADNVTFADLASAAFTAVSGAHVTQRLAVGGTAVVRRYVRVSTTTVGGFTSATFAVAFMRNLTAITF